jgi:DNA-binding MarR family transcriptional regulator
MTDVNLGESRLTRGPEPRPAASLLFLRDDELDRAIELLFFGYRDFVAEADEALSGLGLGRAHHRALHFIARQPGLTVGRLIAILKITKQSLNRVLKDLAAAGFVTQTMGSADRRQRHLNVTESGLALQRRLAALQRARIARAFRDAGPEAVTGFRRVLASLIDEDARASTLELIAREAA